MKPFIEIAFVLFILAAAAKLDEKKVLQKQAAFFSKLARRDVGVCVLLVLLIGWAAANQGKPAPERGTVVPVLRTGSPAMPRGNDALPVRSTGTTMLHAAINKKDPPYC